jgi:hypothetical protein
MIAVATMMQHTGLVAQVVDLDSAAAIIKEKGVYEQNRVVEVDGATASKLYSRAMEALSDWTGSDGRSKAGLDYCDKEEGIVTYKGEYYNGYHKLLFGAQMPFYTDFTMKVRCKDGRAQITVTVPSMHAILPNGTVRTISVREIVEAREKIDPKKIEKSSKKMEAVTMREIVEILIDAMTVALKKDVDDDF